MRHITDTTRGPTIDPVSYPEAIVLAGRIIAGALLILLSPILLVVSAAIRFEGRGPIFFRQMRAGLDGELFLIYKFRSMRVENTGPAHLHRTTRVGRLLRRYGLDELPQLLNVVRGDMCFVGPRPTLPEQVARYGRQERRRLSVKPGITGWAQVNGRNRLDWSERIALDLWYVDHRSPIVDLRILGRTVGTVLSARGVYGCDGVNPDFVASEDHQPARAA